MRRHPGAIKRQQRAMGRARVALRNIRRSTGGPSTSEPPASDGNRHCGECLMNDVEIVALRTDGICPRCGADYGR